MQEEQVKREMQEVIDMVISDISTVRTGRATPALVEDIVIEAYGGQQKMRVVETASISVPDPQTIVIDPWDKSIIGDIRKGILAANVGMNPSIDGQIIRISMPPLTTEDRQRYVKLLGTKLENGKVMVRRIRSDVMREIKTAFEKKELSEDDKFAQEKRLQELTDENIAKIEERGAEKEKELLQG